MRQSSSPEAESQRYHVVVVAVGDHGEEPSALDGNAGIAGTDRSPTVNALTSPPWTAVSPRLAGP